MFEEVEPGIGHRFTNRDDRVAVNCHSCKKGSPKLGIVLGETIAHTLKVAAGDRVAVEVDRLVGQLRLTAGGRWGVYKWSENGMVQIQVQCSRLGVPSAPHCLTACQAKFDEQGRLLIALPPWAKPVPRAANGNGQGA